MTQYAEQREDYVASGLALHWQLGAEKKTGVGFTPEDEKPPPANAGEKETKPKPGTHGL